MHPQKSRAENADSGFCAESTHPKRIMQSTEVTTEVDEGVDADHCLNITLKTNVLHLADNEEK